MNRLVRGSLVLVIVTGMAAASTARGDIPDEWKSLDVAGLTKLAQQLRAKGDAGKADRRRLAAHVANTYLANAEATKSVTVRQWYDLARYLRGDLSDKARTTWAGKLRTAFAGSELKTIDVIYLADVMRSLGDHDAPGFVAAWMDRSKTWKSCKPGVLIWLARRLRGGGKAAKAGRLRLAGHVASTYLANAEATRSVTARQWYSLARSLGGDLSDETSTAWVSRIRNAFGGADLKTSEVISLTSALYNLGDQKVPDFIAA